MSLGERVVSQNGRGHFAVLLHLVENPGLHIQRLGRDPQRSRDLLQDLGTRLAQAALDLAQVRGHAREIGQLAQRELR